MAANLPSAVLAATYYVAVSGNDTASGSIDKPFATLMRAQQAAAPGDTVYIRGGNYTMTDENITRNAGQYAIVNDFSKSGTKDAPINYFAYPGERPAFDFSKVRPQGRRNTAFLVSGSWLHFKGIEVTGVQVTVLGHTQSECFRITGGSNNILELLNLHDGMAIGVYLTAGANNLILNCDAYRNWDNYSEGIRGGNVDGFGCHPANGGTGNVFRGCRAWFNSDDGYDCINAHEAVTWENCWAFYNGFSTDFQSLGDGNGFKDGGYGATAVARLPNPIPNHIVRFCLSVRNKANGFYSNHHLGANTFINNTAYRNPNNFNMLNRLADNATDVPGYGQTVINNLGYNGTTEVRNLPTENNTISHNYFNLNLTPTDADFLSMDESELTAPRQADGSLPDIRFMHLVPTSQFIDKGEILQYPYAGKAPELGAFEYYPPVKVANFGFEAPAGSADAAWVFGGSSDNRSGIAPGDGPKAPEGKQTAFLQGKGTMTQTLSGLTPTSTYKVIFWAALKKGSATTAETWDVKLDDKVLASYAPPSSANDFLEYTATFTATAPSQKLAFAGTNLQGGDNTVFLDNVSVVQTSPDLPAKPAKN